MPTYVGAGGAVQAWINSRPALVGEGMPLQKGAHFHHVTGAAPVTYAFLEELPAFHSADAAEDPDMMAIMSAQIYGGSKEAAAIAATALAEEVTGLNGAPALVTGARLWVADDVQGPTWAPDGRTPRYLVQFTVRLQPA